MLRLRLIKKLDNFHKNIILVFFGTSLINIFNLLYQLLLAHRMSSIDFAAFNSLLSIFMLVSIPLTTIQTAAAKYSAEFSGQNHNDKVRALLSRLTRKMLLPAVITFFVFFLVSPYVMAKLKISSFACGYILAALLALSWITPLFLGTLQGMELFNWIVSSSLISGALKLGLALLFIGFGFNIAGALGALLVANLIGIIILIFPLRAFFSWGSLQEDIDFKGFFSYLFPVAISLFCFTALVNYDMVLVKYFFNPTEAGFYSLAQMLGKIFLFLPGAISIVLFPRAARLNAVNMDSRSTLILSLLYALILCAVANAVYNFYPVFVLKALTGKTFGESMMLGRLFGVSMSFFALLFILVTYFLSVKDLRFIKYLVLFTLMQFLAIVLFHANLIQVQLILCLNSILLFFIHLALSYKKRVTLA